MSLEKTKPNPQNQNQHEQRIYKEEYITERITEKSCGNNK